MYLEQAQAVGQVLPGHLALAGQDASDRRPRQAEAQQVASAKEVGQQLGRLMRGLSPDGELPGGHYPGGVAVGYDVHGCVCLAVPESRPVTAASATPGSYAGVALLPAFSRPPDNGWRSPS